jgi:hypothetical protein
MEYLAQPNHGVAHFHNDILRVDFAQLTHAGAQRNEFLTLLADEK